MADAVHAIGKAMFDALMRGDKEATIAAFADDAEIFDPHYPRPHMRGKAEIRAGLDWGFGSMKSFGFDIRHYFPGKDGRSGVFEVDTHHVLKIGKKLDFPQIFVMETDGGKVTALIELPDAEAQRARQVLLRLPPSLPEAVATAH